MAVCNLQKLFGKRKRKSSSERCPSPLSSDSKAENTSSCVPSEIREQKHFEPTPTTTTTTPAPAEQSESESTETSTTQSSCTTYGSSSDENDSHSDLDSKPAAVSARSDDDSSGDSTATAPSTSHFLMLGSDVMISVVSFLEPRETLNVLTMPLCKEFRVSYTSDQELWRTVCCTDPFSADLNRRNPASGAAGNSDREENDDDDDDGSFCSLSGFDETYDGSNSNCVLGEYRLVYTSFVRCMNYLERIQKNDLPSGNNEPAKKAGKADRMDRFPMFGVTKSLRKFLSRGNERGILKSVIGDGNGDMSSAPIGISSDGSIQVRTPTVNFDAIFDVICFALDRSLVY